jgi:LPXTG-motif cell wall-anchored protein
MVFAALAATAMLATSAGAQYVPGTPGIVVDPSCSAVGGNITVLGSGAPANATITITVQGITLGTVTASGDGNFQTGALPLPSSLTSGQYTVHATSGTVYDTTTTLDVATGPCAVAAANVSQGSGTLPVTGTNSGEWVKAGLSLVAIGGLLVLATRRRRALV